MVTLFENAFYVEAKPRCLLLSGFKCFEVKSSQTLKLLDPLIA